MAAPVKSAADFKPSKLGTKSYWDEIYDKEIDNFEDTGDEGEVWFGYQSVTRVAGWIEDQCFPTDTSILDLGCGNGAMLLELHERGYSDLTGVDYSEKAVALASKIAAKDNANIEFETADMLGDISQAKVLQKKYNIVIDKGTYDAISLNPDKPEEKRELYIVNVKKLLPPQGHFIITSCNWTEEEVLNDFKDFHVETVMKTPSFSFGGKSGSTVVCVVFKTYS